jgi:hypothetical protein
MQPWVSTTIDSSFPKERIGLVVLIAFFCALILISRFQFLVDFPHLAPAAAESVAQESNKSDPHKDRVPSAKHQTCADDDDDHDPDRYLLPFYCYPLSRPLAKILAASENVTTGWISKPTVPPPRRL